MVHRAAQAELVNDGFDWSEQMDCIAATTVGGISWRRYSASRHSVRIIVRGPCRYLHASVPVPLVGRHMASEALEQGSP
jgi:hypothetical protein